MSRPILAPMVKRAARRLRTPLAACLLAAAPLALPAALASDGEGPPARTSGFAEGQPRCFGAPARDPVEPCRNPALATRVFPTPEDALLYPNAECEPQYGSVPYQCTFGVPAEEAKGTVVLMGDSHATHWRGALLTLTEAYGWHGISMTRSGCTFSTAEPVLPGKLKQECLDWRQQVIDWFAQHPEVRTVFISQHPGAVVAPEGQSEFKTKVRGFRDAWRLLPDSVRHIVIIRDTPYVTGRTPDCVTRAMRRKLDAGLECALPRRRALKTDHAAIAAERFAVPGLKLVDMTRFMCDDEWCYPVVGGALTHKDTGHITVVFSETLGPFLLRKVRALGIRI